MSMNCETVRELIPMCADKTASEQTKKLVSEHMAHCPECRRYYKVCAKVQSNPVCASSLPQIDEKFAVLSKRIKRRRNIKIFVMAAVSFIAGVCILTDIFRNTHEGGKGKFPFFGK